jgi:2,4-dienoyl-CoA reductase-like NADH-dependent reductase (Old Yellow Enzyme family)
VLPPPEGVATVHLGLYHDAFVPGLSRAVRAAHDSGVRLLATIDAPASMSSGDSASLRNITEAFSLAAWRAAGAKCDGIMLRIADRSLLHQLASPRLNRRSDGYSGTLEGRVRLALELVEAIRERLGRRGMVGVRLVADEFYPDGLTIQDARVIARRLVGAGVKLLDVTVDLQTDVQLARFPGWCIPLANGIKRMLPDVPVIGSGQLGDPHLADSVIQDGSVDLVMLGQTLQDNPDWPLLAREALKEAN